MSNPMLEAEWAGKLTRAGTEAYRIAVAQQVEHVLALFDTDTPSLYEVPIDGLEAALDLLRGAHMALNGYAENQAYVAKEREEGK